MTNRPTLNTGALREAPALIESVFPAQKVSFEAQKERKAQASQTLTALGSFWKGRCFYRYVYVTNGYRWRLRYRYSCY